MPGKQNAVHDTIHGNMYGPDVGIQAEHWHGAPVPALVVHTLHLAILSMNNACTLQHLT